MKYFLFFIAIVGFVIYYTDSYTAIYNKIESAFSEDDVQKEKQVAFSILEAIAQLDEHLYNPSKEPIQYLFYDENGERKTSQKTFIEQDYEVWGEENEKQRFLKENVLIKFYYELDSVALKELPSDLHAKVSQKLKERFAFVADTLKQAKQNFLEEQQKKIENKKHQENLEKENKKHQENLEKENKKHQENLEKENKKHQENLLLQQQNEHLLEENNKLKQEKLMHEEEIKKQLYAQQNKNKITHKLFPITPEHFWQYRVLKFVDKEVSWITFYVANENDNLIWQDNRGEKQEITVEDGFIKINGIKILPCSMDTKSWESNGYSMNFSHDETIATEAGIFNAFVFVGLRQINNQDIVKKYYVPEIGEVKQERFLSGKKIYEKTLTNYKNKPNTINIGEKNNLPKNVSFFPVANGYFWEYNVLKLLEGKISQIRLEVVEEDSCLKLKDNTGYSPTIATSENFIMLGLDRFMPLSAKLKQNWQRGKFSVTLSHFGELITTDAGSFHCLVVVAQSVENPDYIVKEYYAHNIGEVKKEIYEKNQKVYERILYKYKNW